MGLAPAEFYKLQYCELVLLLDGYRDRIKHEARRTRNESAWLGHIILLPHTPKDMDPLTPSQLLGHKSRKKAGKRFATPVAALDAFFAAQSKQHGVPDGGSMPVGCEREVRADG